MFSGARAGVQFNSTIEQNKIAFETLLGSAEKANERIASIVDFAAKTPFELTEIVENSRTLEVMAGSAFASERGLTLVGDAASVTNQRIEDVAFWVGRLVSGLKGGQPFGEASLRLQEMGLLSGEARQQLERLTGQALSQSRVFEILNESFARTEGGMEQLAQTFSGRISTLKDSFNILAGELTEGLFDQLNASLQDLLEKMDALPTAAERAANGVRDAVGQQVDAVEQMVDPEKTFDTLVSEMERLKDRAKELKREIELVQVTDLPNAQGGIFSLGSNQGQQSFRFKGALKSPEAYELANAELKAILDTQKELELQLVKFEGLEAAPWLPSKSEVEAGLAEMDEYQDRVNLLQRMLQNVETTSAGVIVGPGSSGFFTAESARAAEREVESLQQLLTGRAELNKYLAAINSAGTASNIAKENQEKAKQTAEQTKAQALTQALLKDEKKYDKQLEKSRESIRLKTTGLREQLTVAEDRIRALATEYDLDQKLLNSQSDTTADDRNRLAARYEAQLLELLQERFELQTKLDTEAAKGAKEAFDLKLRSEDLQLEQIRHERELATTNSQRIDLINQEKAQISEMVDLMREQAEIAKDPSVALALNEQADALQRQLDRLRDLNKTRLEQSVERFNNRNDPTNSFGSASDAANGALLDASSEYANFFDQIYEQVTSLNNAIEGGLSDSIKGLLDGTQDLDDAWKGFANTVTGQVTQSLADMAAKWIANQIRMHVLGQSLKAADTASTVAQASTQTAALGPALLQNIASFGAAGLAGLAGLTAAFVGLPKILGARKDGGPVSVGGTYLVGENGPELWTAPRDGYITPNHELGQGGKANVSIALVNDVATGQEFLDTRDGEQKLLQKLSQLSSGFQPS
jgi:hypothetical protein